MRLYYANSNKNNTAGFFQVQCEKFGLGGDGDGGEETAIKFQG